MASESTRIRTLNTRARPNHHLGTTKWRGELYFAELMRRPVKRGSFLIMTDQKELITKYQEGDPWFLPLFNTIGRQNDIMERMLEMTNAAEADHERRSTDIADELEDDLKQIHLMDKTRSFSKNGHGDF